MRNIANQYAGFTNMFKFDTVNLKNWAAGK